MSSNQTRETPVEIPGGTSTQPESRAANEHEKNTPSERTARAVIDLTVGEPKDISGEQKPSTPSATSLSSAVHTPLTQNRTHESKAPSTRSARKQQETLLMKLLFQSRAKGLQLYLELAVFIAIEYCEPTHIDKNKIITIAQAEEMITLAATTKAKRYRITSFDITPLLSEFRQLIALYESLKNNQTIQKKFVKRLKNFNIHYGRQKTLGNPKWDLFMYNIANIISYSNDLPLFEARRTPLCLSYFPLESHSTTQTDSLLTNLTVATYPVLTPGQKRQYSKFFPEDHRWQEFLKALKIDSTPLKISQTNLFSNIPQDKHSILAFYESLWQENSPLALATKKNYRHIYSQYFFASAQWFTLKEAWNLNKKETEEINSIIGSFGLKLLYNIPFYRTIFTAFAKNNTARAKSFSDVFEIFDHWFQVEEIFRSCGEANQLTKGQKNIIDRIWTQENSHPYENLAMVLALIKKEAKLHAMQEMTIDNIFRPLLNTDSSLTSANQKRKRKRNGNRNRNRCSSNRMLTRPNPILDTTPRSERKATLSDEKNPPIALSAYTSPAIVHPSWGGGGKAGLSLFKPLPNTSTSERPRKRQRREGPQATGKAPTPTTAGTAGTAGTDS